MIKSFYILICILFLGLSQTFAQHEPKTHDESHFQHHRLGLFTGYGLIPGAVSEDGGKEYIFIPAIGMEYEYCFNHKFALGFQNDLELSSYVVENEHGEHIDREYAFVSALVFIYEPVIGWALFAGPGYEFERNHEFPLVRVGTAYSKPFDEGWSVGFAAAYDVKEENSSLTFGVTVGKRLGKQK